ncbi:MAG: hypothetical protein JSS89_06025 [Bacteroidetes bacterium]|nr:hypothetical protein [Bacteroidota bacterium]
MNDLTNLLDLTDIEVFDAASAHLVSEMESKGLIYDGLPVFNNSEVTLHWDQAIVVLKDYHFVTLATYRVTNAGFEEVEA